MDHLYNRLDGLYPHKWRSNFQNQQAIDNWCASWAESFEEEGITPNDVKAGLKACRTRYDWPPSCAEFIKACKPEVDPMVAYYEAVNGVGERERGKTGEWSHPAIFWAAATMSYDLQHLPYASVKTRWERALAEQMQKGTWAEIPVPMIALPAPGKGKLAKEAATRLIEDFNATNVIKNNRSEHRAWIGKILERQKRGDSSLPSISVQFAMKALKEPKATT